MAAREESKAEDVNPVSTAARRHDGIVPVNRADLTDEQFVRSVALALRAEWEGEVSGHFMAFDLVVRVLVESEEGVPKGGGIPFDFAAATEAGGGCVDVAVSDGGDGDCLAGET